MATFGSVRTPIELSVGEAVILQSRANMQISGFRYAAGTLCLTTLRIAFGPGFDRFTRAKLWSENRSAIDIASIHEPDGSISIAGKKQTLEVRLVSGERRLFLVPDLTEWLARINAM
jgi:hypothetical protein